MAQPFSTNELFLRSDRIAFGKIPPEVPSRLEQTLILPDETGSKLYFGLSSLVSTSGLTGTLEAIYPQYAAFTFDNLNSRLGINVSSPQYALDISTTTGVRVLGGPLIANASGLVSVPTAALFSTLPSYVFSPGTIPLTALTSTGGTIPSGISVPTAALFSTLPTSLFASSSIPLVALQSSGIIIASTFVGDGTYLSNIPLANINGSITGDFFKPNTIPLSTLASTGQIWIRNPQGSIFAPIISTGQFFTSSLFAPTVSTVTLTTNRFLASSIVAQDFESQVFSAVNLSAINIKASSIQVLQMISSGRLYGDGQYITNLTPANLNNVIPADKFGYRLIAFDAINPYGNFVVEAGTATFRQAVPVYIQGIAYGSTFQGGYFRGDGGGLYNLPGISSATLYSTIQGLGTLGYVSSTQLTSTVRGLATAGFVSSTQLTSTVRGLATAGYVSSTQLMSTVEGLGSSEYISSSQLLSTVAGLSEYISSFYDQPELNSTIKGLGTAGYVSTLSLYSTVAGLGTSQYISTAGLRSTVEGLASSRYISSSQLTSTVEGLATSGFVSTTQLISTIEGLGSSRYISSTQLLSTVAGLGSIFYLSTTQLTSTIEGLATSGFVSTTQLTSTIEGLGSSRYISSAQLISTVAGLEVYVSSFIDVTELTSTIVGLGTVGIVSTIGLTSTIEGLGSLGYVSSSQLTSTVEGLGSSRYISSAQLISTVAGLEVYVSSFIDPTELTSTVVGLGTAGIVSTLGLTSTIEGLGTFGYVSTLNGGVFTLTPASPSNIVLSPFANSIQKIANGGNDDLVWTQEKYPFLSVSFQTSFQTLDFQQVNLTRGFNAYYGLLFHQNGYVYVHINGGAAPGLGLYDSNITYSIQLTPTNVYWYLNDQLAYAYDLAPVSSQYSLEFILRSVGDRVFNLAYGGTTSPNQAQSSFLYFASPLPLALRPSLLSTVEGLGSAGYISTLSLVSTTHGLQELISSCIDSTELTSTIEGLGTFGYVSTASLVSTTQGLQDYISSFIDPTELTSTVIGLGTVGIVSTIGLTSTTVGLGTLGYVSTASLVSTTQGLQEYVSSFIDPTELTSTVVGLGTAGIVSTIGLTSTIVGLGSSGYVSTLSLVSTTSNVIYEFGTGLSTLSSAISGAPSYQGQLLYLNQTNPVGPYKQLSPYPVVSTVQSTVTALAAGSDSNLLAAFQTDYTLPPFLPTGIWDLNLFAETDALTGVAFFYTLSSRAPNTSELFLFKSGLETIANIGIDEYTNSMPVSYTPLAAASTLVLKLYASNSGGSPATFTAYFQDNLYSHVHTTFNAGQESGASGVSSLSTVVALGFPSTVTGLGSSGYVSTLTLNAAISSLSTAYGFVGSLAVLPSTVSTFALQTSSLTASTITAITLSSFDLRVSSINGQLPGSGSLTSIPSTLSTFSLLTSSLTASTITVNYISSLALWVSSINGAAPGSGSLTSLPSTISTFALLTSSLIASTIQTITLSSQAIVTSSITANYLAASTGVISSFSTSILNFTAGFGYLTMPDIFPNTVYTSTVTASNLLVGWNSQISPIQFFGFGTYSNTVISELSTGATTQELVLFRGSNASDRIRMQTTGSIVFEPGVSARLWPTVPSNVTPAMTINTSSNVGIQIAAPTVPLDVGGAIRAISLSTQQIATSSILGSPFFSQGATFTSSVTFRGPSTFFVGAMSTSFLTAGPAQIYLPGPVGIGTINPAFLLDVAGTGEFSTILTSSLTSWMTISTTQLGTSSVVANTSRTIVASSFQMGASTFTGKWNDAQYYVLQTI